jgi:hypothetical protein
VQAAQAFALLSNCSAGSGGSPPAVLGGTLAKGTAVTSGQANAKPLGTPAGGREAQEELQQRAEPCITLPQMVDAVLSIYKV